MYLALVLLLHAPPVSAEPKLPSREEILASYDEAAAGVTEIIDRLPARLGVDADQPQLGFTMYTEDAGTDAAGLPQRHTFILAVFRGSPASAAGVRPGDRIAAIGDIPCDTLLPKAVLYYLSDHPHTVPLTLQRGNRTLNVLVRRAPLACAAAVWRSFPEAKWRANMVRLRERIVATRSEMAAAQQWTPQQTLQMMSALVGIATVIEQSLNGISDDLNWARSPRCQLDR